MQVARPASAGVPILELDGVALSFGAVRAVDDVRLSFRRGGRYAILGANGAGKTSLFNIVSGELAPTRGRVLLAGEDITHDPVHRRVQQGLRRTFQSSRVLRDLSVMENAFLAVRGVSGSRFSLRGWRRSADQLSEAHRLLALAGLTERAELPAGLLSHGQQRQLEIAMGLAGQPVVVLFDEPAAGLSPHERERLTQVLLNLPREACFVMIEHDLDIALRFAEQVTVMHQGSVFRQGTPAAISADEQVQAIYMGTGRGH
jgi:branched-chain amino acid transport system ATP-binding protein